MLSSRLPAFGKERLVKEIEIMAGYCDLFNAQIFLLTVFSKS